MAEIEPKKRVALYIRVSSKEQAEMYGEALQKTQVMKLIDLRDDLEFAGEEYIYIDSAVSGAEKIEDRPELSKLFDDLKYSSNNPFDVVVVYKIDRLARKLSILIDIVDRLNEHNVGFISTQESIDTVSPFGRAMLNILGAFSELERDTILEKTSLGREEAIKEGVWMQNRYGYRRNPKDNKALPEVEKAEAEIIRKIFDWYVNDRMTISEICKELTQSKVLIPAVSQGNTGRGKKIKDIYNWGDNTVRKILGEDIYIGNYYYEKTKQIIDKTTKKKKQIALPREEWRKSSRQHTSIIEKDVFEKAQIRLEKKGDYKNSKENYILSGLLKCDDCKEHRPRGMLQWKGTTSNGHTYYQCGGKGSKHSYKCNVVPLPKKDLEEFVINNIKALIQKPALIEKFINNSNYNSSKQRRLENKKIELIKRKEKILGKKDRTVELYRNMEISREEYQIKMNSLSKEIKDIPIIEAEIDKIQKEIRQQVDEAKYKKGFELLKELTKNIDKIFSDLELTRKLFNYIIEEIVIYSRPRNETDIISGVKKGDQKIPNHIEIVFRLPQEFFDEMLRQDFLDNENNPFSIDFNPSKFINNKEIDKKRKDAKVDLLSRNQGPPLSEAIKPIDLVPTSNFLYHSIKGFQTKVGDFFYSLLYQSRFI